MVAYKRVFESSLSIVLLSSSLAFAVMSRGFYFRSRARRFFEKIERLWTDYFETLFECETKRLFTKWPLTGDGRLREVVASRRLTVFKTMPATACFQVKKGGFIFF